MLEISNLSVSYGDHEVVHNASLTVPSGTITVVLGPNGCGKTTFLRAVCGLLPSTSGRVVLNDTDVTSLPTHRRGIGMLFQSTQLFPAFDVLGNVEFGLRARRPRLTRDEIINRAEDALRIVDMIDHTHDDIATLSGGQARRVDIARVLAPRPKALLLDEPTSMLDAASIERVISRTRSFVREHSLCAVCITHDVDEADLIGDTVVDFHSLSR